MPVAWGRRARRAREILTRLQPIILERLAQGGDADTGFIRFHNFLENLPAGVQIFSLFQSNPHVLSLLIDIITVAPRLAAFLGANSGLIDTLVQEAGAPLSPPDFNTAQFEATMDALRRYVHEEQFRIGTRSLAEPIMATAYGEAYTPLAETAINTMLQAARDDIERQYGTIAGAEIVILGLGKLGSREMTLQSDLDLILICDAPDFAVLSDGDKAIDAERWFARLARRFISGLSAPTAEGELFEVDTRLRPSGNAGPLVTKRAAFESYQNNNAWTWEHMALTRAAYWPAMSVWRKKCKRLWYRFWPKRGTGRHWSKTSRRCVRAYVNTSRNAVRSIFGAAMAAWWILNLSRKAYNWPMRQTCQALIGARDIVTLLDDLVDSGVVWLLRPIKPLKDAALAFLALRQIASLSLEDDETEPAPATRALLLEALNEPDMARLQGGFEAHRTHVTAAFKDVMNGLAAR